MSIHIEDLTVRFKNSVTAIDHADLDIPNGIFVATHIKRLLPIPIHILRKSIDNVLANIPQKKIVTTIAPKQVIN